MLVRFASILWPLQLNLEPLCTNLETIHGLDGALSREGVVVADETKAFAEVRVLVDEHFGADDATKWLEHLHQIHVLHIIGQVVDEEITPLGACDYIIITSSLFN